METTTFSSGLALAFGALHALEPCHGKTALLAYIASGKRRSWKESVVISVTSAITHSLAIFFIAFASHFLLHHGIRDAGVLHIRNILSAISGTLICSLGIWTIYKGRKGILRESCHACVGQTHGKNTLGRSSFLTSGVLGIATGIIPCPTALIALLSGVSSGNPFLWMQNVICFAFGMCFSLMGVIVFCSLSGEKLIQKLKNKRTTLNWSLIQGVLFIVIGLGTTFYGLVA